MDNPGIKIENILRYIELGKKIPEYDSEESLNREIAELEQYLSMLKEHTEKYGDYGFGSLSGLPLDLARMKELRAARSALPEIQTLIEWLGENRPDRIRTKRHTNLDKTTGTVHFIQVDCPYCKGKGFISSDSSCRPGQKFDRIGMTPCPHCGGLRKVQRLVEDE